MSRRTSRHHLLLSTAAFVGALAGYGRGAYAQQVCTPSPASNIVCDGASSDTQDLTNRDDASVTTGTNFSVDTRPGYGGTGGNAVTITGDGALSYTDVSASALSAAENALYIKSNGDIGGGNPGSITVDIDGTLTGGSHGIYARNYGGGATTVTANSDVTGTNLTGINVENGTSTTSAGTDLTVTTGADTTVMSDSSGIRVRNFGSGTTAVEANGDVTGTTTVGLAAQGYNGTDVTVTTGTGTTVSGGARGIFARNFGSGTLTVTTGGDVTGTNIGSPSDGIYATNVNGTDLGVTTGADTVVSGGQNGIFARNLGSGALEVTANGDVTGTASDGIAALSQGVDADGKSSSVTTAAGTTVTGGQNGIFARSYGSGTLTVDAKADVTGTAYSGIYAQADNGTGVSVTTGGGTSVEGGNTGIFARNYGSGATTVAADSAVEGTAFWGIYARGSGVDADGNSLTVTTGDTVTGGQRGIYARNTGSGALTVTANGDVTGTDEIGIFAENFGTATDLSVTTEEGTTVTGGNFGMYVANYGTGATTITANGDIAGTNNAGIVARNEGTGLTVTTAAGTTVGAGGDGIFAVNNGSNALNLTANGDVAGTTYFGIYARNEGTDLNVTTAAGTAVNGGTHGVYTRNNGSGALNIEANGDITGNGDHGIYARHFGGGAIDIGVASSSTVTSNGADAGDFAIATYSGPASVTVAGTLNGGGGGAVQFDQTNALDDRLALETSATINGAVLAGPGTDMLAFGGTGTGAFDLNDIDAGAGTQQYRNFETFQVESGIWNFSGATAEAFTVAGGTLGGTGTFGGLTVNDGGTLAPGNSIGTITVNGAFALEAGAIFEAEVNAAGESDKIIVNGTVNLTGATLRVLAENGNYRPSTDYTIVENDGNDAVNGEFSRLTSNLAFLTPFVTYDGGDGNDVVLSLIRNDIDLIDVAQTSNQRAVAGALDRFALNDPLFLAVLNQSASGARQAFNALSGEIHASVAGTLADDSRYTREAVLGRLMQATHGNDDPLGANGPQVASLYDGKSLSDESLATFPPERASLAFWTQGFGAWGDYDSDGNAASVSRDLGGFISGLDADIGGSWRAGLTTGASFSSVDVNARYSTADVETYHLGGYVGGMAGGFALRGGGLYAWNSIDTSRAVMFPGFFERQNASYDADTGQLFGEIAYPTKMGGIALEPFGGIAFVSVDTDSFRERGGALASLSGVDTDQDVGYTTLGLRAATTLQWGNTQITPHISAAWQHAFDDVTPGASLAFASNGIGFGVDGVPLAENSALLDAGLDFALGENGTAGVSYSGQYGDGVTDNAVKGRITWLF